MSRRDLALGAAISLVLFASCMILIHSLVVGVMNALMEPLMWVTPLVKP